MKSRNRSIQHSPQPDGDLLQMITISLFIILIAFFILLNSIAVLNEQKVVAAIGSLLGSFGQKTGGYSVIDGSGEKNLLIPVTTHTGRIDFSDIITDEPALSQQIQILTDPRGSLVRIQTEALFHLTETAISPSGYPIIDSVAAAILKNQYPVEISCHTDNLPIMKNNMKSNQEISAVRALNILQYCNENKKISIDRLIAYGLGEYQPAYSNRTLETRKLNNRVDFLFVHKLKKQKPKGGFIFKDFFFRSFE